MISIIHEELLIIYFENARLAVLSRRIHSELLIIFFQNSWGTKLKYKNFEFWGIHFTLYWKDK